jgi:hypothetical protein
MAANVTMVVPSLFGKDADEKDQHQEVRVQ